MSNASVTLQCPGEQHKDAHSHSAQDGSYRFPVLSACRYTLTVDAEGYSSSAPVTLSIAAGTSQSVHRDITLSPQLAAKRPNLQAAGIHGLIDPGGYSASLTAGAATDVLHDISGVQREAVSGPSESHVDCTTLEQQVGLAQANASDWQASATAGHLLLRAGDSQGALPLLQAADRKAPFSALEPRLDLAEALLNTGHIQQAADRLAAISPQQLNARGYALRARAAEALGQYEKAIPDRRRGLEESSTAEAYFALAYDHLLTGDPARAKEVLQNGLQSFPQSISLLVGSGAVAFFQHDAAQALQSLLKAADLDPSDDRPYPLLSDIGRTSSADATLVEGAMTRHLALKPDDASGNAALGSFLLHHANAVAPSGISIPADASLERARHLLEHALDLSPALTGARLDLASIDHRQGNYRAEAEQLARIAEQAPSRDVEYRLGLAYRASGQPDLAQAAFLKARSAPDHATTAVAQLTSSLAVHPPALAMPPCSPAYVWPTSSGLSHPSQGHTAAPAHSATPQEMF